MTREQRETAKAAIDAAKRQRIASEPDLDPEVVIAETDDLQEAIDNEEALRRAALAWRSQPWRLFTACSSCGAQAYCAGKRREAVECLGCFISPPSTKKTPTTKRRISMSTTTTVSLREPFIASAIERAPGVEHVAKAAYSRLVLGKRTLAYVNGDRKLTVELRRVGETGLDKFSIASEDDFAAVIDELIARLPSEEPAVEEVVVEAAPAKAKATAGEKTSRAAKPDPKSGTTKRTRSSRRKATA